MEGRNMSVERNLPIVRERRLAILKGDPQLSEQQKKAGKLLLPGTHRAASGCRELCGA